MARGKAAEKAAILQRQLQALDLRKRGLSYRAIGEKLNVDPKTAYNDVMSELGRLAKQRDGKVEELRELELERLDMLITALEPMARVGDPSAVNSFLKCMERRAKYLGLDAPAKFEHDWRKEAQAAGVDDARLFEEMVNAARATIAASAGTAAGGSVDGGEEAGE